VSRLWWVKLDMQEAAIAGDWAFERGYAHHPATRRRGEPIAVNSEGVVILR